MKLINEINTYLPWVSEGMIHKPQNILLITSSSLIFRAP